MSSQPIPTCHVVAVPYPGRGHINPMMNLCRVLASKSPNILITFVVTEEWLGFIHASDPLPPQNVRLRSIPNVIPSEIGRAKDFVGFIEAVNSKMTEPFEELLDRMDTEFPVKGIVADVYVSWTVNVGVKRGISVNLLFPMSASFFSGLYHIGGFADRDNTSNVTCKEERASTHIPGHKTLQISDFNLNQLLTTSRSLELALNSVSTIRKAQTILFTSFYELEPTVFDTLRSILPLPVYAIGPSIPYMLLEDKIAENNYINWLDSQPDKSVLYISLGSFLSVSGPQMDEIANGLRLSKTRFLWVARSDSSDLLRLQEMVGDMGLLVPWCDQLKVMQHRAIGGFLTHCGWNSTLEAVYSGLPMLTFPIFWDQPIDSKLITDEWKIGMCLKREGVVGREEIAHLVERMMDSEGSEGKEMRRRAMNLREAARGAVVKGGSSYTDLDSFVREVLGGI